MTKLFSKVLCCFFSAFILLCSTCTYAGASEYTVGEVQSLIDGIVAYKLNESGSGSVQEWIDGSLTAGAGTVSEWYIITLSQSGYTDLSSYREALTEYLDGRNVASASSREKYALALCAAGSGSRYISDILDDSIGQQGIMSLVYGLHILNNGYSCSSFTADSVADQLLSMQYGDGGWALFGGSGDVDVTAMTIQALAPYYDSRSDVRDSIDRGLDFLSSIQLDDGGYESFGSANPESAAQVLTALSSLGIDCQYDDRFIKNGNSVIDGIARFRLSDGSFSHAEGGGFNETATIQAYYAFTAYERMANGQSPLFIIDNRQPQDEPSDEPVQNVTEAPGNSSEPDSPSYVTTPRQSGNTQNNGHRNESSDPDDTSPQNEPADSETASTAPASKDKKTAAATSTSAAVSTSSGVTSTSSAASKTSSSAAKKTAITTSAASGTSKAAATTAVKAAAVSQQSSHKSYKPTAIIIIIGAGAVFSLIIFIMGKRSYKNFIFVGIAAAAAVTIVLLTDISSPEEYYNGESIQKENAIGTVTLEIRCDTVAGKTDSEYIPEDGTILPATQFSIEEGETVYDILTEAARTYGIQVENKGSSANPHGMVYIAGINYLYEFDFGDLSGWVYHVNGVSPSRGCAEYELSDGDTVEWLYTCELGRDLNEVYEE